MVKVDVTKCENSPVSRLKETLTYNYQQSPAAGDSRAQLEVWTDLVP